MTENLKLPTFEELLREDLVARSYLFAAEKHKGQIRKYTGEPYIVHPMRVARIMYEYAIMDHTIDEDRTAIAACFLHDVVEDCDVPLSEIFGTFGLRVSQAVEWLTNAPHSAGNKAARAIIDRDRLAASPQMVQLIKCCDILDNIRTIVLHDPGYAVNYLRDKRELIGVMEGAKGTLVRALVKATIKWGENRLKGKEA